MLPGATAVRKVAVGARSCQPLTRGNGWPRSATRGPPRADCLTVLAPLTLIASPLAVQAFRMASSTRYMAGDAELGQSLSTTQPVAVRAPVPLNRTTSHRFGTFG